jgi:hypothetical protein
MIPARRQQEQFTFRTYRDLHCEREYGVNAKAKDGNHQCDANCHEFQTSTGIRCCVKKTKKRIREAWLQNRLPEAKRQRTTPFGKFVSEYCKNKKCSKEYAIKKYLKALDL